MIANVLVIVLLLGLAYWWSLQGLFSAWLHLLCVVAAGALAFALWEPLVTGFLIHRMPYHAWGVGLIAPFVLLLIGLRAGMDQVVTQNLYFDEWLNKLGGAVGGFLAAVLCVGIGLIGVGFLPLPAGIGGYKPYFINADGDVVPNRSGQLWLGADEWAERFFASVSYGPFAPWGGESGQSLALYHPALRKQASLYRLSYDENASPAAVPGEVVVKDAFARRLPLRGGPEVIRTAAKNHARAQKIVVVDTEWRNRKLGTYDSDGTLRVSPSQIHLVAWDTSGAAPEASLVEPVAYSQQPPDGPRRLLDVIDSDQRDQMATSFPELKSENIGWVFLLGEKQTPKFLLARQLRLRIPPDPQAPSEDVLRVLGRPKGGPVVASGGENGDGENGSDGKTEKKNGRKAGDTWMEEVALNDKLPRAFSKNKVMQFQFGAGEMSDAIRSGSADRITPPQGAVSQAIRVRRVYSPSHQAVIRIRVDRESAQSMFGAARAAAASLRSIFLRDGRGQEWQPMGYVLLRSDNTMKIRMGQDVVRRAADLPASEMTSGDELYLYFSVGRGVEIESFNVGREKQDLSLRVPTRSDA